MTSTGRALESSEAETHPARLGWEWLWPTRWPEIPERPPPAGWAKLRLRRVARRRACATPPRFHRQSGGLGADEAQPDRNSESARDSKSDHDSCGRQKPEVPIRNRTGRPPGRSSGLNFSHRTRSAGRWPPSRRARADRARGGPGRAQARERKESDTPASQLEDQDQRSRKCTSSSTQIQRRVNRSQRSRGWLYAPGSSA